MFATLKLLLLYVPLGTLAGLTLLPLALVRRRIGPLYGVGMWIARAGLRAAGVRVELTGLEHIPPRSCLFMANHVSNLDPPVLLPILPGRISVLLKRELMSIPLLGPAMRLARFVPVDRSSRRDAALQSMTAAAEVLRDGLHLVVFPEGTRSSDGRLLPFKKGPFFLARETGAPVIPVAISGTERSLPKGSTAIRPGPVSVQLLTPIWPAEFATREELMGAVHEAIARALPPAMQPAGYFTMAL